MNHICQKNNVDCGHAVAAMLLDIPYTTESHHYVSQKAMLTALSAGWHIRRFRGSHPKIVDLLPLPRCALFLRNPEEPFGHWIAMEGETVYDPGWYASRPIILANMSGFVVLAIIYQAD